MRASSATLPEQLTSLVNIREPTLMGTLAISPCATSEANNGIAVLTDLSNPLGSHFSPPMELVTSPSKRAA